MYSILILIKDDDMCRINLKKISKKSAEKLINVKPM